MKTNIIKRLVVISGLAIMANVHPAVAQSETGRDTSQSAQMQSQTDGAVIDESAGADNSGKNWSWIGLLGLAGLFGLKRHGDVRDHTYGTART